MQEIASFRFLNPTLTSETQEFELTSGFLYANVSHVKS